MIWIPPGTLIAGTPRERTPRVADEELPGEPVELSGFYIDEFAYPNEAGAIPKTGMTRDEAAGLCTGQGKRLVHRARVGARVQGTEQHGLRIRRFVPRRGMHDGASGKTRAERAARRLQERIRRSRLARRSLGVDVERLAQRGRFANRRRARRQLRGG